MLLLPALLVLLALLLVLVLVLMLVLVLVLVLVLFTLRRLKEPRAKHTVGEVNLVLKREPKLLIVVPIEVQLFLRVSAGVSVNIGTSAYAEAHWILSVHC